jgi:hypothetical protein
MPSCSLVASNTEKIEKRFRVWTEGPRKPALPATERRRLDEITFRDLRLHDDPPVFVKPCQNVSSHFPSTGMNDCSFE